MTFKKMYTSVTLEIKACPAGESPSSILSFSHLLTTVHSITEHLIKASHITPSNRLDTHTLLHHTYTLALLNHHIPHTLTHLSASYHLEWCTAGWSCDITLIKTATNYQGLRDNRGNNKRKSACELRWDSAGALYWLEWQPVKRVSLHRITHKHAQGYSSIHTLMHAYMLYIQT